MRSPREGRPIAGVSVSARTAGDTVHSGVETLPDGTFTLVGSLTVGDEGEGHLEISTHDGDTLPYGVASAGDLAGLHVELRSPASV